MKFRLLFTSMKQKGSRFMVRLIFIFALILPWLGSTVVAQYQLNPSTLQLSVKVTDRVIPWDLIWGTR